MFLYFLLSGKEGARGLEWLDMIPHRIEKSQKEELDKARQRRSGIAHTRGDSQRMINILNIEMAEANNKYT